jgi:4-hydroxybenzoate polyprenyltransferase
MSEKTVRNKEDLKSAIASKASKIRVEGVLAGKIKRTLLIPKATFVIASASAGVAIYSLLTAHEEIVYAPLTGGVSTAVRFGAAGTAAFATVSLLGTTTAWSLIGVGIALGGLAGVKTLRSEYKVGQSGADFIVLVRK